MGHHKPAYGQKDKPAGATPSLAANKQTESASGQKNAKEQMNPPKPRWWGLTRFERIMAVLTFAGVVIAVFTGLIFLKQLGEMRTDQRAWVNVSTTGTQFMVDKASGNVTVTAPIVINNTGKTPAAKLTTQIVVEKVINGSWPDFIYEGRVRTINTTGSAFPNSPQTVIAALSKGKPNSTDIEPRLLSPSEYQDLIDRNAYIAVYARTTYVDVFGTDHWSQFCVFSSPPGGKPGATVTAKPCTDYNNVDNN